MTKWSLFPKPGKYLMSVTISSSFVKIKSKSSKTDDSFPSRYRVGFSIVGKNKYP